MGFLDTLSSKEKIELKMMASENPLVAKLCAELKIYEGDPTKSFYSSLKKAIGELGHQIHTKELDADSPYTKSIIKLAESGSKIFDTLQRGAKDTGNDYIEDEIKKEDENISIVDKIANQQKSKL